MILLILYFLYFCVLVRLHGRKNIYDFAIFDTHTQHTLTHTHHTILLIERQHLRKISEIEIQITKNLK